MAGEQGRGSHSLLPLLFGIAVLAGLSVFFIPAAVLRPSRYQSPRAWLAMAIHQHAPSWTVLITVMVLLLAPLLWGRAGRWQKLLVASGVLLIVAIAALVRTNYFEWMFHPVAARNFEPASQVKLDSCEMVMAVRSGADAPIRSGPWPISTWLTTS